MPRALQWVLGGAAAMFAASASQASPCDRVSGLDIAGVRILRATAVGPEAPLLPPLPSAKPLTTSFCRVEGIIEREIGFEIWLPAGERWNHRLLVGGVGGQAGSLNYYELVRGVGRGYAAASTDTGHKATDRHWLLGPADRAANYAERANHLLAMKAKAIISEVYGQAIQHAFFVGCSGGGRQALTEVQRFPADFDGVIAGAPGVNTPEMSARRMWEMQRHSEWGSFMGPAQWKLIADAAVRSCDSQDGVRDGVIDDPTRCRFDPRTLRCDKALARGCLTDRQLAAALTIYSPLHDENGRQIDQGLLPGIQVQAVPLPEPFAPGPPYLAVALFGDGVHRDANWDARQFRIASDLPAIDRVMNLHADDPDISAFVKGGGKLILYQGWADPLVAPQTTVAYYRAVQRRLGKRAEQAVRLFMVPGVEHCRGGAGPDLFGGAGGDAPQQDADHDMLSALEAWVQRGVRPEQIIAVRRAATGVIDRTRPLCSFPMHARYLGRGSTDQATNFVCEAKPLRKS
ncbi:MAG: tannase/feruloyl esterase family alpha/beta hydrolase [Sphingomicrobium sp.]